MAKENKFADEILSDDELDQVAGGGIPETSNDSKLLYERGLVDDWHGVETTAFRRGSYSEAVDAGWSKAGITCVTKPFKDNQYFINGKEISRYEAYNHVKANFKQIRTID